MTSPQRLRPAGRPLDYPPARRLDLTEEIFGHRVADPYRWLEDPGSTESAGWLRG